MAIDVTFGGTTITGARGWDESMESRVEGITIPRAHGEIINYNPKLNARVVTIPCQIIAATNAAAWTALNLITAAVSDGRQKLTQNDARYLWAVKRSIRPSWPNGLEGRVVRFTIEFLCDDPFYYDVTDADSTDAVTAVATGFTVTITPTDGDAPTPPVLTFTPSGALTSIRIQNSNVNINKYIQWDGTLTSGSILEIDMKNKTVTVSGVNGLSDTVGDFFDLAPNQANALLITSDANGSLLTEWTDRWY